MNFLDSSFGGLPSLDRSMLDLKLLISSCCCCSVNVIFPVVMSISRLVSLSRSQLRNALANSPLGVFIIWVTIV